MSKTFILMSAILLGMAAQVAFGHTVISSPTPRDGNVHTDLGCGSGGSTSTYGRGATIEWAWGRNNHASGFVNAAVVPSAQAGDNSLFLKQENIIQVNCYSQSSCRPPKSNIDKFGFGGDGVGFQGLMCKSSLTIPTYLPDGDYVLKSTVYGNGDSFGVRNMAHTSYTSCHNFKVQGGAAVTTKAAGGRHIRFNLVDDQITQINTNGMTDFKLSQGQCLFSGTNVADGCMPSSKKEPNCAQASNKVRAIALCGGGNGADSRAECLGFNQNSQTDGGDLYNYMVGLPTVHPDYKGVFTLISHIRAPKIVAIQGVVAPPSTPVVSPPIVPPPPASSGLPADGNCIRARDKCPAGKTCYAKDQYWADCRTSCTPGVHPEDPVQYRTPWSCAILGGVCTTQDGGNCISTKCCKKTGDTCFEKDKYWGSCMASCTPGKNQNDPVQYRTPWSCKALSGPERVPFIVDAPLTDLLGAQVTLAVTTSTSPIWNATNVGVVETTRYLRAWGKNNRAVDAAENALASSIFTIDYATEALVAIKVAIDGDNSAFVRARRDGVVDMSAAVNAMPLGWKWERFTIEAVADKTNTFYFLSSDKKYLALSADGTKFVTSATKDARSEIIVELAVDAASVDVLSGDMATSAYVFNAGQTSAPSQDALTVAMDAESQGTITASSASALSASSAILVAAVAVVASFLVLA